MSMEITQSVTSRRLDIPSGYIPISSFGCHKGNTDKKASEEYKALYQAWCDERISGIKLMKSVHDKRGQIFVDPVDADRVIAAYRQPKPIAKSRPVSGDLFAGVEKRHVESACESLADISSALGILHKIVPLLERMAAALESIATQPKDEPAGVWPDINGESL